VRLKAELAGKDLAGALDRVRALGEAAGMAEPASFATPIGAARQPIEGLDPARVVDHQLEIALADGAVLSISTHPGVAGTLIQASRAGDTLSVDEVRAAQLWQAGLLRGLLDTGDLRKGQVERLGPGLDALPDVPLAGRLPVVTVTEPEVAGAYADPGAFWAAWDEDRVRGDLHLLSRHLEEASTPAWFDAAFESQWAMARAARPGGTVYGGLAAPPGCEALLMRGESRLHRAGYRDGRVELAAFVPADAHIPPWEILTWNEALLRGRLEDGSPLSALRVVFRDEAMARREATPLLDIGAEVAYLGRDGEYHTLA
jgi:hypothetical protein